MGWSCIRAPSAAIDSTFWILSLCPFRWYPWWLKIVPCQWWRFCEYFVYFVHCVLSIVPKVWRWVFPDQSKSCRTCHVTSRLLACRSMRGGGNQNHWQYHACHLSASIHVRLCWCATVQSKNQRSSSIDRGNSSSRRERSIHVLINPWWIKRIASECFLRLLRQRTLDLRHLEFRQRDLPENCWYSNIQRNTRMVQFQVSLW